MSEKRTWLEQEAIRLAGIPGWEPWSFDINEYGCRVSGAVCPPITRGPNKGKPNYRKHDKTTFLTVQVRRVSRNDK